MQDLQGPAADTTAHDSNAADTAMEHDAGNGSAQQQEQQREQQQQQQQQEQQEEEVQPDIPDAELGLTLEVLERYWSNDERWGAASAEQRALLYRGRFGLAMEQAAQQKKVGGRLLGCSCSVCWQGCVFIYEAWGRACAPPAGDCILVIGKRR